MNQPSQTLIDLGKDVREGPHELPGILAIPAQAKGIVIFTHGSGSEVQGGLFVDRLMNEKVISLRTPEISFGWRPSLGAAGGLALCSVESETFPQPTPRSLSVAHSFS